MNLFPYRIQKSRSASKRKWMQPASEQKTTFRTMTQFKEIQTSLQFFSFYKRIVSIFYNLVYCEFCQAQLLDCSVTDQIVSVLQCLPVNFSLFYDQSEDRKTGFIAMRSPLQPVKPFQLTKESYCMCAPCKLHKLEPGPAYVAWRAGTIVVCRQLSRRSRPKPGLKRRPLLSSLKPIRNGLSGERGRGNHPASCSCRFAPKFSSIWCGFSIPPPHADFPSLPPSSLVLWRHLASLAFEFEN